MGARRTLVLGVGIFVLLVLSLQIFLIMVGLEAWLTYDRGVAWAAAVTSVVLATFSVLVARYVMRPDPTVRPTSRPARRPVRPDGS